MSCLPLLRYYLIRNLFMISPFLKVDLERRLSFLRQGSQSCFDSDQVKNMGVACFFLDFYPHKYVPELFFIK